MPELPEVEYGRKVAEKTCKKKVIQEVHCDNDPIVFETKLPAEIKRALVGRRVLEICRRGKFLWFELDKSPWPIFHFGMTGAFHTPDQATIQLETGPKIESSQWPPRFTKIRLVMEDGCELAMTNSRRLGRVRLSPNPLEDPSIAKLGFDPLTDMPDLKSFQDSLGKRKANLKGLLLNQKFAAGVGNWIADEVLFQAGIAPTRRANTLRTEESLCLYDALTRIVKTAVELDADKSRFPENWLFHHRWGQNQDAQTAAGDPIEFAQVGGRTTAWVPARQS